MKKLLAIDGNSILNRAFYGIRLLTNQDGLYTNAIYGMITMISRQIEALKPDYCAVAFDLKAPTFRHKMYDAYKANRSGMPEELAVQLPYAKECMSAMGLTVIEQEGYEADDVLGTLSQQAKKNGVEAYLMTGDRDSLQLIGNGTSVLLVRTKETVLIDEKEFQAMYGVESSQFVDVKALMGDSSDNIPGVKGIGEKTALKLISDFRSLDELYESLEQSALTASVKQKLTNGRDMAYLSKQLATICCEAPLDKDINKCVYNGPNRTELYRLFSKLDFSALIRKFDLEDVSEALAREQEPCTDDSCPITAVEIDAKDLLSLCKGHVIAVSLEEECLSFGNSHAVWSVPLANETAESLSALFSGLTLVSHDCKKLCKKLAAMGLNWHNCYFDTMLAAYAIDAGSGSFELSALLTQYGVPAHAFSVVSVYRLYETLRPIIQKEQLEDLLYDIEQPLAFVLAEMEQIGFRIDVKGVCHYGEELKEMAEALQSRIYSYVGEPFNIASPKQLGEVLFEKMGLPKSKKTKTGYSTDAETLQKLLPYHPIIEDILDYRQVTKLKSTYADGLAKAADEEGRVHSIFSQTGTTTGRLSSSEPNLQNIPIKTEIGRQFRRYFIPKNENYVLVDADYSQIELRILAHVSGDETMRDSFLNGLDIHTMTASKVFGVDPNQVTIDLRKRAKAINFGILYGMGEYSLSEDLGISRVQAKQYIESYLAGFPKIREYLENIKTVAREQGYVTTEFGRKRYIPELSAANKNLQRFGERVAMNSPIQGTAADIIKVAMIRVNEELKKNGMDARLILQVHDELLLESNVNCADEALTLLRTCMEEAIELTVPLSVDAHIGTNWFEAK